jgi:hypothetical protein
MHSQHFSVVLPVHESHVRLRLRENLSENFRYFFEKSLAPLICGGRSSIEETITVHDTKLRVARTEHYTCYCYMVSEVKKDGHLEILSMWTFHLFVSKFEKGKCTGREIFFFRLMRDKYHHDRWPIPTQPPFVAKWQRFPRSLQEKPWDNI